MSRPVREVGTRHRARSVRAPLAPPRPQTAQSGAERAAPEILHHRGGDHEVVIAPSSGKLTQVENVALNDLNAVEVARRHRPTKPLYHGGSQIERAHRPRRTATADQRPTQGERDHARATSGIEHTKIGPQQPGVGEVCARSLCG